MKRTILSTAICLMLLNPFDSKGQVIASMYNINLNDAGRYDFDEHPRHNRPGKILLATGILVGGLAIGAMASQQDYYISNTTIYGTGGVLTIIATGLIIGSVNCLNKEIKIAYNGNSVGVSMCLNSVSSQKRRL